MMKSINLDSIRSILVTRTDRIGDVVLSTPVFKALKERFPAATIYALVLPTTRDIVRGNPYIDEIIVYDKRGAQKQFLQSVRFGWALRPKHIDVAVHLHPTNRVHILSLLAGIPIRIGYKRKCSWLLTHAIPERKREGRQHEAEYNFDLLKLLDVPLPETMELFFLVGPPDDEDLECLLAEQEVELNSFIVMLPSASCPSKIWPAKNFADLADTLYEKYTVKTVLVGDAKDRGISQQVVELMHAPAVDLTGHVTLKILGALLRRSRLLIANDSGPVHIAASLNVPVIALFGRSDPGLSPQRWRPLGQRSFFLHKQVGCIRCLAHNCDKEFRCLQAITVNDVLELIRTNSLL